MEEISRWSRLRRPHAVLSMLAILTVMLGVLCTAGIEKACAEDGMYSYDFGTAEEYSTFNKGFVRDSFYYSDDWFDENPEVRNDELALMSMKLTAAVIDDDSEGSETGKAFLEKLGFDSVGSYGFHTEDPDDMSYMFAKKKLDSGETLIAVIVQSSAMDNGIKLKSWKQNFTVNGEDASGEHYAFSKAAEMALPQIETISDGTEGNVKYWIMGHSRGGALADLISAKLPAALREHGKEAEIFGYTFEAPAVVDAKMIDDQSKYRYIHNYSASDDIVTMVPPAKWGMTLYGEKHEIKSEETDAKVNEELEKLGSKARLADEPGLGDMTPEHIIEKLLERIPTRKAYTEKITDTFTMPDGTEVDAGTPQDIFVKLMEAVFGENRISTAGLADRMSEAAPALDQLIRACLTEAGKLQGTEYDANVYYYNAARELCKFLKPEDGELPFSEKDAFEILKLAGPVFVDPEVWENDDCKFTDDPMTFEQAAKYIGPAMKIVGNVDELTFSHHFDTSIARLKVLAPAPAFDGIDLVITDPEAGDAVLKAVRDAEKAGDDLGLSWLDISARWETEDPVLRNNKVNYFAVTYYIKGHSVPEELSFTLNGKKPEKGIKISHKDGITVVRMAYRFEFGEPVMYEINFGVDAGEGPASLKLPDGTMLKYVDYPVPEPVEGYEFSGWYDPGIGDWDDITVDGEDLYFIAKQAKVIDDVRVSFTVPAVGAEWKMPSVPKNAPYHIEEACVENDLDSDIEKIKSKIQHTVHFNVAVNSDKFVFKKDDNDYTGNFTLSGAELDSFYMDYTYTLSVSGLFMPKDNNVTALQKGGDYKMADKVIRASKSNTSLKGSSKSPLKLKAKKKTKKSIKLTWKKTKDAKKYVVYGALKGKKFVKIKSLSKTSFTVKKAGKKLAKGKKYKFIVVAVGSGSKVVSTSRTVTARTAKK